MSVSGKTYNFISNKDIDIIAGSNVALHGDTKATPNEHEQSGRTSYLVLNGDDEKSFIKNLLYKVNMNETTTTNGDEALGKIVARRSSIGHSNNNKQAKQHTKYVVRKNIISSSDIENSKKEPKNALSPSIFPVINDSGDQTTISKTMVPFVGGVVTGGNITNLGPSPPEPPSHDKSHQDNFKSQIPDVEPSLVKLALMNPAKYRAYLRQYQRYLHRYMVYIDEIINASDAPDDDLQQSQSQSQKQQKQLFERQEQEKRDKFMRELEAIKIEQVRKTNNSENNTSNFNSLHQRRASMDLNQMMFKQQQQQHPPINNNTFSNFPMFYNTFQNMSTNMFKNQFGWQ